jgi:dihydropteroate synthase
MGVLNVTPDSFYDGGRFIEASHALDRAAAMVAEGAAIIDVGGESTRPGADVVTPDLEIDRVVPVIEALTARLDVAVSVDTSKPSVMAAATAVGAVIVNDVHALRAPGAREWAAESGVGVCLMHMQGEPGTMQLDPHYDSVVTEVAAFLRDARLACLEAGISGDAIALDPGIGFGKTLAHNLALLRHLSVLVELGSPVVLGVSRKTLIGRLLGGRDLEQRLPGGLGLAALAVSMGVSIIRTHDVAATVDAVGTVAAVMRGFSA